MAIFGHGITLGNKVYLYRLLAEQVGFGKQTYLPRIQEVLDSDGIYPQDMGCETVLELMEQLSEFVRVASFKGGRAYVTLSHVEKWDVELEKLSKGAQKDSGGKGGRPWKRSKGSSTLRPQKPRHRERKKDKAKPAAEPEVDKSREPAITVEVAREEGTPSGGVITPAAEPAAEAEQAPEPEQEATAEPAPEVEVDKSEKSATTVETAREEGTTSNDVAAPAAEPAAEAEQAPEPEQEATAEPEPADENKGTSGPEPLPADDTSRVRLTVTYDPYADMERDLASREQEQEAHGQAPAQSDPPKDEVRTLPRDLPQTLSAEAQCPGKILVELSGIVPLGNDPLTWLDRDWQRARSYGLISGTRSNVTFPLTLKRLDGTGPATATLRKTRKASSTRLWQIVSVEIGSAPEGEVAGIEGTARTSSGPWSLLDVLAASGADPLAALESLSQEARESARTSLTDLAEVGQWCTGASTEEVLTHLALMLAKAQAQSTVVTDGDCQWFSCALVGKNGEPLEACVTGDAIHFRESATAHPQTGPAELLALNEKAIAQTGDDTLSRLVASDGHSITQEEIEQAQRLARTDWRRALCAWSPDTNQTYLLLPLAGSTTYVSLRKEGSGLTLCGALSSDHALACARTISAS